MPGWAFLALSAGSSGARPGTGAGPARPVPLAGAGATVGDARSPAVAVSSCVPDRDGDAVCGPGQGGPSEGAPWACPAGVAGSVLSCGPAPVRAPAECAAARPLSPLASSSIGPPSSSTRGRVPVRPTGSSSPLGRVSRPRAAASCRGRPDSGLSRTKGGRRGVVGGVRDRCPLVGRLFPSRASVVRCAGPPVTVARSDIVGTVTPAVSLCPAAAAPYPCRTPSGPPPAPVQPGAVAGTGSDPCHAAALWCGSCSGTADTGAWPSAGLPCSLSSVPMSTSSGCPGPAGSPVRGSPAAARSDRVRLASARGLGSGVPGAAVAPTLRRRLPPCLFGGSSCEKTCRSSTLRAAVAPGAISCVVAACAFCVAARSCRRVPG